MTLASQIEHTASSKSGAMAEFVRKRDQIRARWNKESRMGMDRAQEQEIVPTTIIASTTTASLTESGFETRVSLQQEPEARDGPDTDIAACPYTGENNASTQASRSLFSSKVLAEATTANSLGSNKSVVDKIGSRASFSNDGKLPNVPVLRSTAQARNNNNGNQIASYQKSGHACDTVSISTSTTTSSNESLTTPDKLEVTSSDLSKSMGGATGTDTFSVGASRKPVVEKAIRGPVWKDTPLKSEQLPAASTPLKPTTAAERNLAALEKTGVEHNQQQDSPIKPVAAVATASTTESVAPSKKGEQIRARWKNASFQALMFERARKSENAASAVTAVEPQQGNQTTFRAETAEEATTEQLDPNVAAQESPGFQQLPVKTEQARWNKPVGVSFGQLSNTVAPATRAAPVKPGESSEVQSPTEQSKETNDTRRQHIRTMWQNASRKIVLAKREENANSKTSAVPNKKGEQSSLLVEQAKHKDGVISPHKTTPEPTNAIGTSWPNISSKESDSPEKCGSSECSPSQSKLPEMLTLRPVPIQIKSPSQKLQEFTSDCELTSCLPTTPDLMEEVSKPEKKNCMLTAKMEKVEHCKRKVEIGAGVTKVPVENGSVASEASNGTLNNNRASATYKTTFATLRKVKKPWDMNKAE